MKVIIFIVVAIALLFIDSRLQVLGKVRLVINMVIYPVQRAAVVPRDLFEAAGEYLMSTGSLHEEISQMRQKEMHDIQLLQQAQLLERENEHLRELLGMSQRLSVRSVPAEILYDARNAFIRKIILNRGSKDGVMPGQPVIDDKGVIGQVTEVYLAMCEVTLLTDKDQAIPVMNVRSGERSVAFGKVQTGHLELRFMMANADIAQDDVLVTSGIDGVYPAGLVVGKIVMEKDASGEFVQVICEPVAGVNRDMQVLILLSDTNVASRPTSSDRTVATRKRQALKQDGAEK